MDGSQDSFDLPAHIVAKVEKVLGLPSAKLEGYDFVRLIEELCDTALMFERDELGEGQAPDGIASPP